MCVANNFSMSLSCYFHLKMWFWFQIFWISKVLYTILKKKLIVWIWIRHLSFDMHHIIWNAASAMIKFHKMQYSLLFWFRLAIYANVHFNNLKKYRSIRIRIFALNSFESFQSQSADEKEPLWHDIKCFFNHFHPPSTTVLSGFGKLRLIDQSKVRRYIGNDTYNSKSRKKSSDLFLATVFF